MNTKIGNKGQVCSAYRFLVAEGKGKGEEMLLLNNGVLSLLINLSRGGDIHQAWWKGKNVCYLAKNGLSPHEEAFEQRFPGGLLYTCGLDAIGGVEGHELHGRFHLQPAEIRRIETNEEGILVELEIEQNALFGEKWTVRRRYELKADEALFSLRDEVKNDGFLPAEYALLYHCNIGYPFLDEGSRLEIEARESLPRNVHAANHFAKRFEMEGPLHNMEETCYFHSFENHEATLTSPRLESKLRLRSSLPCLVEWKCRRSGEYVLGLEPATSYLDEGFAPCLLPPGESVCFSLEMEFEPWKGDVSC